MVSGRKPDLQRRQWVLSLRDQGFSLTEIGRRLGVRRQAVHQIVKAAVKAGRWTVACCACGTAIASAGVVPRDDGDFLCLLCLSRKENATFGERLKAFRLAVGLTRGELVQMAGIQSNSVQHYEEGRKQPQRLSREKLARALGLTVEVLQVSSEPVTPPEKPARKKKTKPAGGKRRGRDSNPR
jgi:DNA-binding XRE family transcriptional regulator